MTPQVDIEEYEAERIAISMEHYYDQQDLMAQYEEDML